MEHILLQKALNYKRRKTIEVPIGYIYNRFLGAWINDNNSLPLVESTNFHSLGSKKEDLETGEDRKGE